MTMREFNEVKWYKGIKALYKDGEYWVRSVDFEEYLLGLVPSFLTLEQAGKEDDMVSWVRCERCTIVNEEQNDERSVAREV